MASTPTRMPAVSASPLAPAAGGEPISWGLRPRPGLAAPTSRNDDDDGPLVHVIDGDPAIREAMHDLLRSVRLRAATFGTVAEFLSQPRLDLPGCLVLEIRLPGLSGLEFQRQLAQADIPLPVVFMTGHADVWTTVRAMKAGAVDVLAKPFREQDMLDAVMAAIERDRARRNHLSAIRGLQRLFLDLTAREREVMPLVADGLLNKQIAHRLSLSEFTVKIHRGRLMRKMNARSVADLVRMADRLRDLPPPPR